MKLLNLILSILTIKTKVGLLLEEEKEALEGNLYTRGKYFTPIEDGDGNWVLPLTQIKNNKNIDFWWVTHLEKIDYKPKKLNMFTPPRKVTLLHSLN